MVSKALVSASIKPMILSILVEGADYGYNIIQCIHDLSDGKIVWTTGTLYPLLHGLENEGLLESTWQRVENAPRRKYYRLTPKGRAALEYEKRQWVDVTKIMLRLWGPQSMSDFGLRIAD
jgi:PadR family transcriptional regulator PadR